ncbi:TIGR02300 family protein [Tistrella mobilis]|uniref:Transcription initiation factor TFIIIB, Brf1 subunit/Transcription initiation factor TFIIB n=1 Tax=Tistrella mobilis (strain KA081020-065) TaxID=1110502 RepID=I3TQL8_TISMK|nr:TIGR02300 family protein [Tistrella mobilis]AFK55056.1 Transcription initiation factor TFIIIB, Brf1 subunit/Transcription initiation factor TFIIB [Tistrella mobilis KA081020-065]MAM74128.1 TIGR02300 family protein [Tistrella sp.]
MAKEEWGQKHTCRSCGARFYDMRRTPVTCPKCGAEQPQIEETRSRRAAREADELARERAAQARKAKVVPAEVEDVDEEGFDEAFEDDDEDDVGIEDASELGDDDVGDVRLGDEDDEN